MNQYSRLYIPVTFFSSAFLELQEPPLAGFEIAHKSLNLYFHTPLSLVLSIFLNDCTDFQVNKHMNLENPKTAKHHFPKLSPSFKHCISVDSIGPLNISSDGNLYLIYMLTILEITL